MEASTSQAVEITVDKDLCAASAMCPRIAPLLFSLPDDADTAIVLQERITDPEQIKLAEEAEAACPTLAIILKRS